MPRTRSTSGAGVAAATKTPATTTPASAGRQTRRSTRSAGKSAAADRRAPPVDDSAGMDSDSEGGSDSASEGIEEFIASRKRARRNTKTPGTPPARARAAKRKAPPAADAEDDGADAPARCFQTKAAAVSSARRFASSLSLQGCARALSEGGGVPFDAWASRIDWRRLTAPDADDDDAEGGDAAAAASAVLSAMASAVDEGSPILGSRQPSSRQLEANFRIFWHELAAHMHATEALYSAHTPTTPGAAVAAMPRAATDAVPSGVSGDAFLPLVAALITACSQSEVRPFRYAASVAGYALVTSLVEASLSLEEKHAVLAKQLRACENQSAHKRSRAKAVKAKGGKGGEEEGGEGEGGEGEGGRGGGALLDVKRRMTVAHHRQTAVSGMLKRLFQDLVILRFRDVAPPIRALTVQSVGSWVVMHPSRFLSDSHLKYIAWSLNDRDATVRRAGKHAFNPLPFPFPSHSLPLSFPFPFPISLSLSFPISLSLSLPCFAFADTHAVVHSYLFLSLPFPLLPSSSLPFLPSPSLSFPPSPSFPLLPSLPFLPSPFSP